MTSKPPIAPRLVEFTGMILIVLGLVRVYMLFNSNGYLPPPFVFDVGDTFMDWFNTAYWAHNPGAYSVWRTIYLPLSFVITGALGNPACYINAPYDARECDDIGIAVILLTYVVCVVVAGLAFYRRDRSTALFRTVAVGLGGPLLFALERGNLIMLAFIPFVMLFGGLVRSRWGIAGCAAILGNLKVYLIFPLAALAIRRQWRLLELSAFAMVALYILTLLIVQAGTPFEFVANLQNWFGVRLGAIWDEVLYTTTYKPFLQLDAGQYPVRDYLEQRYVDAVKLFIQYYVVVTRGVALLCIGLAWLYPRAISTHRLAFFLLMQSFIGQNPGGYAISLIVFLVFMEKWRNFGTALAIICAYLISIPGDWTMAKLFDVERQSWLSGRIVMSEYVLPLGSLVRPGVIAIMLWSLAIDSLLAVHRAARLGQPSLGLIERLRPKPGDPPPAAAG